MDKREYKYLQERLSKKIIQHPTNKEAEYNKGILTAKSILKEVFECEQKAVKLWTI